MRLGLFMMPLHPPTRGYHEVLKEDLEAVVHAARLGFDKVWIGEHFSSMTEPITSHSMFVAKAIPLTERIRLCTGVLNLPQQHPAVIAGFAAMFDHLANGRFVMGIGPGGLPSEFELFHLDDAMERGRMTQESIDIILRIWAGEPPYRIEGRYWQIRQDAWYVPELGLGAMPKPYQKPHPPFAVAGMSPYPYFVKEAGKRGWIAVSANFIPADSAATPPAR
jgi:alkanesulfonate monooxygenase SsuD/methylene tetrahydromethanopterin reductase-like flavin-dependent oxidoreductase (luciferase family)